MQFTTSGKRALQGGRGEAEEATVRISRQPMGSRHSREVTSRKAPATTPIKMTNHIKKKERHLLEDMESQRVISKETNTHTHTVALLPWFKHELWSPW